MSIDTPVSRTPLTQRLGLEIKVAMVRRGISGRRLAAALGESQTWVSTRLNGITPIDVNDLERIAEALGTDPAELISAATAERRPRPVELVDDRLATEGRPLGRRKRPNGGYPRTPARASRRHPTRPPNRPACPGPAPERPQLTRTPAAAA